MKSFFPIAMISLCGAIITVSLFGAFDKEIPQSEMLAKATEYVDAKDDLKFVGESGRSRKRSLGHATCGTYLVDYKDRLHKLRVCGRVEFGEMKWSFYFRGVE